MLRFFKKLYDGERGYVQTNQVFYISEQVAFRRRGREYPLQKVKER